MLAHQFLPRVATDAREREVPSGARGDQQDSSVRVHLVAWSMISMFIDVKAVSIPFCQHTAFGSDIES
jgi:hypothetical protein